MIDPPPIAKIRSGLKYLISSIISINSSFGISLTFKRILKFFFKKYDKFLHRI